MATHSSILAWEIPSTEEPGGLQATGWQEVRHGLVTNQQKQKRNTSDSESLASGSDSVADFFYWIQMLSPPLYHL